VCQRSFGGSRAVQCSASDSQRLLTYSYTEQVMITLCARSQPATQLTFCCLMARMSPFKRAQVSSLRAFRRSSWQNCFSLRCRSFILTSISFRRSLKRFSSLLRSWSLLCLNDCSFCRSTTARIWLGSNAATCEQAATVPLRLLAGATWLK